jgi:hypothetical protein
VTTWLPRISEGRAVLSGGQPIWLLGGTGVELMLLDGEWCAIERHMVVDRGPLQQVKCRAEKRYSQSRSK